MKFNYYLILLFPLLLQAQDDALLENQGNKEKEYVHNTFKSDRVIHFASAEMVPHNTLQLRFSHRFAPLDEGIYDLFGLDGASVRIGLDYGIKDRFQIGVGRNSQDKSFDFNGKMLILRQTDKSLKMPISLLFNSSMSVVTLKDAFEKEAHRFDYVHQFIIARKFGEFAALQVSPTYVHRNLADSKFERNDFLGLGLGTRVRITNRLHFTAEYFQRIGNVVEEYEENGIEYEAENFKTATKEGLSVGVDLDTGGHIFQLVFTNTTYMYDNGVINKTYTSWGKNGIRFGFSITRQFGF